MRKYLTVAAVFLVLSFAIRIPLIRQPFSGFYDGEDATSHVLATMLCYKQIPASLHHFVPVLTLGRATDKWIDDLPTAARFNAEGDLIYTSWPPLFFVLPYGISQSLHIALRPELLRILTLILHLFSCALLGILCYQAAGIKGDRESQWLAASLGLLLYTATPEALKSNIFAYWAEHLYAPIFLTQLLLFFRKKWLPLFLVFTFLGGLIDWGAYIACAGFFIAFLLSYWANRQKRDMVYALLTAGAGVLSLCALYAWMTSVISFHDLLAAQRYRAGFRSGLGHSILSLCWGYLQSLAFTWILLPLLFWLYKKEQHGALPKSGVWTRMKNALLAPEGILLVAAGFPVVENFLMAQHAYVYSYDRLKLLFPLALALSFVVARFRTWRPVIFHTAWITCLLNIVLFFILYGWHYSKSNPDLYFQQRFGTLVRRTAPEGDILFTNMKVRGHTIYYADHNLYECVEDEARDQKLPLADYIRSLLQARAATHGTVYLVSDNQKNVTVLKVSTNPATPITEQEYPIAP